jgi:hypothetical protein
MHFEGVKYELEKKYGRKCQKEKKGIKMIGL